MGLSSHIMLCSGFNALPNLGIKINLEVQSEGRDLSVSIGSRINSLAEGARFHFYMRISSSCRRKKGL